MLERKIETIFRKVALQVVREDSGNPQPIEVKLKNCMCSAVAVNEDNASLSVLRCAFRVCCCCCWCETVILSLLLTLLFSGIHNTSVTTQHTRTHSKNVKSAQHRHGAPPRHASHPTHTGAARTAEGLRRATGVRKQAHVRRDACGRRHGSGVDRNGRLHVVY